MSNTRTVTLGKTVYPLEINSPETVDQAITLLKESFPEDTAIQDLHATTGTTIPALHIRTKTFHKNTVKMFGILQTLANASAFILTEKCYEEITKNGRIQNILMRQFVLFNINLDILKTELKKIVNSLKEAEIKVKEEKRGYYVSLLPTEFSQYVKVVLEGNNEIHTKALKFIQELRREISSYTPNLSFFRAKQTHALDVCREQIDSSYYSYNHAWANILSTISNFIELIERNEHVDTLTLALGDLGFLENRLSQQCQADTLISTFITQVKSSESVNDEKQQQFKAGLIHLQASIPTQGLRFDKPCEKAKLVAAEKEAAIKLAIFRFMQITQKRSIYIY